MTVDRAVLAVLGVAGGLWFAPVARATESIRVQVMTVRATDGGPTDEQLAPLRVRLRRLVGYRSFQLVQDDRRPVAIRSEVVFNLPNDRSLVLLPKQIEDDVVHIWVRLLAGRRRLVDTNVRLRNGSEVVFGLGPEATRGDAATLIVVRATQVR